MTIEELRQRAKELPDLPGIYMMKDSLGNIIYVGKSKALKKRVSSYFRNQSDERSKVKRMVSAIVSFDYEVTDTELDALLLECSLIKKLKPVYNSLLKNDKRYRYLVVRKNAVLPRIEVAYEKGEEGTYFGPYDMPYKLILGAEAINHYYKLPTCKDQIRGEDCLAYRMKRCTGPCSAEGKNLAEYENNLKAASLFLEGKGSAVLDYYNEQMSEAAQNLEFEKAAEYRNYAAVLKMLRYRKEAIQFSMDGTKGIAFVKMPRGGLKLYILEGTEIIFTKCFESKDPVLQNNKQVLSFILEHSGCLSKEKKIKSALEKSEIDHAIITYYFLKTKDESFYENIKGKISGKTAERKLEKLIEKALGSEWISGNL